MTDPITCTGAHGSGQCATNSRQPGGETIETTDLCRHCLQTELEWTAHNTGEDLAAALRQANVADRWLPANLTRALRAAHVALQSWEAEQEQLAKAERRAS